MENIEKKIGCSSITGFKKIEICTVDEMQSIEIVSLSHVRVVLKPGKTFGIIKAKKIKHTQAVEDGAYKLLIECFFPGSESDYLFNKMSKQKFIVRLTTRNNVKLLGGTIDEPLNFSYSNSNDSEASGSHGYTLSFTRKLTEPLRMLVD